MTAWFSAAMPTPKQIEPRRMVDRQERIGLRFVFESAVVNFIRGEAGDAAVRFELISHLLESIPKL